MIETIQHVVSLWLIDPSDANVLRELSQTAKRLAAIPGVLSVKFGPSIMDSRGADVDAAMMVTLENAEAIDIYLAHPLHLEMVNLTRNSVRQIHAIYIRA